MLRKNLFAVVLTIIFGPFAGVSVTLADTALVGVASVIDGDTIEVREQRIRLHGIDAPEGSQLCMRPSGERWRCGQQAALTLADRIGRATVRCEQRDRDRYGRIIAVCFEGEENLNRWLVASGWAVAYRRYSLDYIGAEESARGARLGIWSGEFVMPWDWRQGERLTNAATESKSGNCLIKGNISRNGERIYHVPGGRWYDRTKIDRSKGERWFCSEENARAAGWRRARQ